MAKGKLKPIIIRDSQAIALVQDRAAREHRNLANAASATIIEALGQDKVQSRNSQLNFREHIREK